VSQLKPGDNVTLRVYANGQYRDVTMKVVRAGDLPRSHGMTFFGGFDGPGFPPVPPTPPLPRGGVYRTMEHFAPMRFEVGPEWEKSLDGFRAQLDKLGPELERIRTEVPRALEKIEVPRVRLEWGRGVEL
jgi:hypothetical protein